MHPGTIHQEDFIRSVADALQHISYSHPPDYIRALGEAYRREASPAARDAIAQLLTNSRMCAEGRRPICQDTGVVLVFLNVGMDVRWDADMSVERWWRKAYGGRIGRRSDHVSVTTGRAAATRPRRCPSRSQC